MTHQHCCSEEQLKEIKAGKRTCLLTNEIKKDLRPGDNVLFQSDTDEAIVPVVRTYEGRGVNSRYQLFSWAPDGVEFEMTEGAKD